MQFLSIAFTPAMKMIAAHSKVHPVVDAASLPTLIMANAMVVAVPAAVLLYTPHGPTVWLTG
eukprot:209174-Ditylum_brightwellii.AAC.1